MTEQPALKSKIYFGCNWIVVIGGGVLTGWLSHYLISLAVAEPYPQVAGLAIGAFFGLFSAACFLSFLVFDTLLVYKDRVEVKSILGYHKQTIYLKDITGYTEIERKAKHDTWTDLTIYTDRSKYKFSSNYYSNYFKLKLALTRGKQQMKPQASNWLKRYNRLAVMAIMLLAGFCFWAAYHFYEEAQTPAQAPYLKTITGVLANKAEIHKGAKGSRSIWVDLEEYPYFQFHINGNAYSATNSELYVEQVRIGDTLELEIELDDYLKKLTREKELTFWDKHDNYKFIRVYGLCGKKQCYLTVSDYLRHTNKDAIWGVLLFGVVGLIVAGNGIRLFVKSR